MSQSYYYAHPGVSSVDGDERIARTPEPDYDTGASEATAGPAAGEAPPGEGESPPPSPSPSPSPWLRPPGRRRGSQEWEVLRELRFQQRIQRLQPGQQVATGQRELHQAFRDLRSRRLSDASASGAGGVEFLEKYRQIRAKADTKAAVSAEAGGDADESPTAQVGVLELVRRFQGQQRW